MSKKVLISINPSNNEVVWSGQIGDEETIKEVVQAARSYQPIWNLTTLEERQKIVTRFSEIVKNKAEEAAYIISEESGKPFWEAKTEVNSLINKVQVVFDSFNERARTKTKELANGRVAITRYKPHGVMAVLGPFNFPMSMPNSHIMPAIYAGNTIVFKPSERTPKSACFYRDMWIEAGLPADVLQIVNGDAEVGDFLVSNAEIDGVLFIGSRKAGKIIEKKAMERDKLCVLEMGGNSPLVIWDYTNIKAALNVVIQSCYISAGQRCSAARRLIVNSAIYKDFITALSSAIDKIIVGDPFDTNPAPFMGPMVDKKAADQFLDDYYNLVKKGAKELVATKRIDSLGECFVSPALLDVTEIPSEDTEIFGPLLQVISATTFDQAIQICNETQYGLAAGLVTESRELYENFSNQVNAGIINWNQQLTGSTTINPFGGIKGSGNFHPAGYLSVDYCVYGCASIESSTVIMPTNLSPGLEL